MMKKFLLLTFVPASAALALLWLRLLYGGFMLVLHGWPKLAAWSDQVGSFRDPLGIGSTASYLGALAGEVVAPLFLIAGLGTRWAAVVMTFTMGVAFFSVHGGALSGPGSGEMAALFGAAGLALVLAGGGRFALDARLHAGAK